ncbi:MAG: heme NO-binding domain-containing protein [Thermoanaerobacteraceae bacterium]|nr:heme NO-binding domain-containing protein [Thermoanaerobacteraceae bacterium]
MVKMKGIIFSVLQEYAGNRHGDGGREAFRRATGLTAPLATSDYPDEKVTAAVGALAELSGKKPEEVLTDFGRYFVAESPLVQKTYAAYFENARDDKDFLLKMDSVHVQTTKALPGATPPRFEYEDRGGELVIVYRSGRKLCPLLKGLIEGTGLRYNGRPLSWREEACMLRGAKACRVAVRF